MEAIRGDARLPDIGQEDRAAVDPYTLTTEDLTTSIDAIDEEAEQPAERRITTSRRLHSLRPG